MATRAEKERKKLEQEKLQGLLNQLLREEDNKYCADCDAKGPRWASWNIGVFLCIRCAGIHRNLGVHVSKVKSVNLDTWTPEQVAHMQIIGNSAARGVYECNLPDNFRRPQSDSAVQAFIQAKYDQKRYIMKDWVRPRIDPSNWPVVDAEINSDRKKAGTAQVKVGRPKSTHGGSVGRAGIPPSSIQPPPNVSGDTKADSVSVGGSSNVTAPAPAESVKSSALLDLVDLNPPAPPSHVASAPNLPALVSTGYSADLLGVTTDTLAPVGVEPAGWAGQAGSAIPINPTPSVNGTTPVATDSVRGSGSAQDLSLLGDALSSGNAAEKKSMSAILALYSSAGNGTGIGGGVVSNQMAYQPTPQVPTGAYPVGYPRGYASQAPLSTASSGFPQGLPPAVASGPGMFNPVQHNVPLGSFGGNPAGGMMTGGYGGGVIGNQPSMMGGMGTFGQVAPNQSTYPMRTPAELGAFSHQPTVMQSAQPSYPAGYQKPANQIQNQFSSMQIGPQPSIGNTLATNLWQ